MSYSVEKVAKNKHIWLWLHGFLLDGEEIVTGGWNGSDLFYLVVKYFVKKITCHNLEARPHSLNKLLTLF